jgi:hypothetical protein
MSLLVLMLVVSGCVSRGAVRTYADDSTHFDQHPIDRTVRAHVE